MTASQIVEILLNDTVEAKTSFSEATVHLPARGTVWIATFTGAEPGQQVWRSTGLRDRQKALALARSWESQAREQRRASGYLPRKPTIHVRRQDRAGEHMTQREVARVLGMSVRGVREVERRAFRKLRNHPLLRQAWQQHLAGDLEEILGAPRAQ